MSKPREWWIYKGQVSDHIEVEPIEAKDVSYPDRIHHVIERAAYDDATALIDKLEALLKNKEMMNGVRVANAIGAIDKWKRHELGSKE